MLALWGYVISIGGEMQGIMVITPSPILRSHKRARLYYLNHALLPVTSITAVATWKRALEQAGFSERSAHTSVLFDDNLFVLGGSGPSALDDAWY